MSGAGAPLRLVVASANPDKAKEIVAVLSEALEWSSCRGRPTFPR